ncbi:MAG: NAD(P)/FAD-dependent oxidoreductase [Alphaproteobacteria bacterium]|nr:NAD(P)/FAD-dependent oxidoreductase [Alphaproteobacteria bacterium]
MRRIAVIGAGPGGITAGVKLKAAGFDDFVIFEKSGDVGGTWNHNRYPGAACDVKSHLYSFSFELNPAWTRPYAEQPEIHAYMRRTAERHGLIPHIRFNTKVEGATWDDARAVWLLDVGEGEPFVADAVISALGMFNDLNRPDIAGLKDFKGTLFHSAEWPKDDNIAGKRVGVIGSAASAVQFVPEIARTAGQLYVFQRSANWVVPKDDTPYTEDELRTFREKPEAVRAIRQQLYDELENFITFADPEALAAAEAAGRQNLEVVEDPETRRKLTPDVPYGCQRPLIHSLYYRAFNRPNVELVTDPIARITRDGIVTRDGKERAVDTIILATGFAANRYLAAIDVTGRGGVKIADAWDKGAQAYLGIMTAGFPNLFMLYGPNTNNGSILYMIERQVDYAVKQLQRLEADRLAWIDVRPDVQKAYNAELQNDLAKVSVWQAGCSNYYRGAGGQIVTQWPHTMDRYTKATAEPDRRHFTVQAAG